MSTNESQGKAVLYSDVRPNDAQIKRLSRFVSEQYGVHQIVFRKDESIRGGFRLEVGGKIYDWTNEGRLRQLEAYLNTRSADRNVTPLCARDVTLWAPQIVAEEIGRVLTVGDGIATVSGLYGACYGEILVFESGVRGMALDLRENEIGCILFDTSGSVLQGSIVRRTGHAAGIPVGDDFIGRVADALGNPIDGGDAIIAEEYWPVEHHAPTITERQPVNTPLETGILAIDAMFPIGKGQRELIIGDRQTGKTAIALDTILNQRGKNVICIYVAIGQKASSVASLVQSLRNYGAMDYTIVIASTAADAAPLQYIAPYAGCALGEYFMKQGRDVLIVYDDLSKHAVAYRSLSLLLGRAPGREAYPGDVFYLHSRLLERSAHLSDAMGGGSLTALPIVETQSGDVSAYIPTNVISITDGQIFLESSLFYAGQRPAVNVGLSVSRVGGNAQARSMKDSSGTLRIDLAQYREMEVFTQFSGELDAAAKDRLAYGKSLMRLLRQKQYRPYPRHAQVILLTVALAGGFKNTDPEMFEETAADLLSRCERELSGFCESVDRFGGITPEDRDAVLSVWNGAVSG